MFKIASSILASTAYKFQYQTKIANLYSPRKSKFNSSWLQLINSHKGNVDILHFSTDIRDFTAIPPSWRGSPCSSIQTNMLIPSVAIETLTSTVDRYLESAGVVELAKSVWYCAAAVCEVRPTDKGIFLSLAYIS